MKHPFLPFALVTLILLGASPQVGPTTCFSPRILVHANNEKITVSKDITLALSWSIGTPDWQRWVLWDDFAFTHFYLLWTLGVDYELQIPATLSLTYPSYLEPGQEWQAKLTISFNPERFLIIRPHIGIGIDVDLLWPIPIQNVWVEHFTPRLEFEWEWTLSFSQGLIKTTPEWVSLTDMGQTVADTVMDVAGIDQYVHVEDMILGEDPLGTLASGEFKINLLHLLLDLIEELAAGTPLSFVAAVLDWFISDVLGAESGLVVIPSVATALNANISTSSPILCLSSSSINFSPEDEKASFLVQVDPAAREGDPLTIDVGPLVYSYSMVFDWEWYIAVNIQLLGLVIAQNEWRIPIMRFPEATWESEPVTERFVLALHVDEPLYTSAPEVKQRQVILEMEDPSGITEACLEYTLDSLYWSSMPLVRKSGFFEGTFPSFNLLPQTIAYQFRVTDGDGDVYLINNAGRPFQTELPPNLLLAAVFVGLMIFPLAVAIIGKFCSKGRRRSG